MASYEELMTQYEQEIWATSKGSSKERMAKKKHEPLFYGGFKNLIKTGFDIHITYGPQAQALIIGNDGKNTSEYYNEKGAFFNGTVKAIRGIYIRSRGQEIDPDGTVYEVYELHHVTLDGTM